jgi:cyanamide hydratase
VVKEYPRGAWSNCFADTVREELGLKPWAHSSAIQDFAEVVEGNVLMAPWDESGKGGERK